jgi:hypothetical protein
MALANHTLGAILQSDAMANVRVLVTQRIQQDGATSKEAQGWAQLPPVKHHAGISDAGQSAQVTVLRRRH